MKFRSQSFRVEDKRIRRYIESGIEFIEFVLLVQDILLVCRLSSRTTGKQNPFALTVRREPGIDVAMATVFAKIVAKLQHDVY